MGGSEFSAMLNRGSKVGSDLIAWNAMCHNPHQSRKTRKRKSV